MHLAWDSSSGAKNINQRAGEAWGPAEVSVAAQCLGHRATSLPYATLRQDKNSRHPRPWGSLGGPDWGDIRKAFGQQEEEAGEG